MKHQLVNKTTLHSIWELLPYTMVDHIADYNLSNDDIMEEIVYINGDSFHFPFLSILITPYTGKTMRDSEMGVQLMDSTQCLVTNTADGISVIERTDSLLDALCTVFGAHAAALTKETAKALDLTDNLCHGSTHES
ncbi:MAG: hypothetical protein DRH08_05840 [Deltaproteobacteria bacterium]|nr:MAG: hypothetical protein DRH08_05840 [Deltaproteobacteria bacterium]